MPIPVAERSKARSVASHLLGLQVRIPPLELMFDNCECVLSGTGLCDGPIPRPEKSYRQ